MAHLPLHGIQTKAQRLSTLAHEVSLAGGHSAWIYRLTEAPAHPSERIGGRAPVASARLGTVRFSSPLPQEVPKN